MFAHNFSTIFSGVLPFAFCIICDQKGTPFLAYNPPYFAFTSRSANISYHTTEHHYAERNRRYNGPTSTVLIAEPAMLTSEGANPLYIKYLALPLTNFTVEK
jgi:hypothetical protein